MHIKWSPYFYHELKLELKGVRPLVTRGGLERSHFVLLTRAWLPNLTESSHALVSPRCGGSPPHLPLYPPPPLESKEGDRAGFPVYDWKGDSHPQFKCDLQV